MVRSTTSLFVIAAATFAVAQSNQIVTEVYSGIEHQRPVKSFALQDVQSGAELWLIDAYGPRPSVEMVGPQLRDKRTGLELSIGFLNPFNGKEGQLNGLFGGFFLV